jgi:anti-repressor protein
MMDELITVVEHKDSRAVNARELHAALKVKRDFSNWIKDRVKKYAFEEGADYSPNLANRSDGSPGKPRTGYLLSLSAAKDVRTAENSDTGRAMRRYLLKAEEAWNTPEPVVARALQASAKSLETCREKLTALEGENGELKAQNAAPRLGAGYYERLVNAHGLTGIHDTAKELGIPEKRFIEFLLQKKHVYRDCGGELCHYVEYVKWFALKDEESGGRSGIRLLITVAGKAHFQNMVSGRVLFQAKAHEFCRRN